MDGLECSEIRMSDVCDTTTLRFDSDYYKKEYLEIEQFICKNRDKFVTIESQGLQVDASAFYPSLEPYYNTGTIPFVRVADVKDSNSFKDKVEKYFTTLEKLNHQAQILYSEAKQILIKELKVCTEGITSDSYTTKYLSTSFKVSGRLDAEYYQPKYDGYLSALEQFETTKIPNEFDVLKNSGTNYAEGVSDVGVIKTKQLTNSGVNTDGIESYFTHETCIENKSTLVVNNDVVFASMGVGSLGKVSLFSYDGDKPFVTDSTLRIYRAKKHTHVLPEVLCIFLQSAIGQELIYRYVVGSTGIINIYDDDIAKIPIPILDGEIQKDIAEKVQNSFALRRQSKQLLEYAKQAVEMAIEQGEDAALVWLKERSGE